MNRKANPWSLKQDRFFILHNHFQSRQWHVGLDSVFFNLIQSQTWNSEPLNKNFISAARNPYIHLIFGLKSEL